MSLPPPSRFEEMNLTFAKHCLAFKIHFSTQICVLLLQNRCNGNSIIIFIMVLFFFDNLTNKMVDNLQQGENTLHFSESNHSLIFTSDSNNDKCVDQNTPVAFQIFTKRCGVDQIRLSCEQKVKVGKNCNFLFSSYNVISSQWFDEPFLDLNIHFW